MNRLQILKSALIGGASIITLAHPAAAKVFDIPDGDLATALASYMRQSDVRLIYADDVRGHKTHGAKGDYTETAALDQILQGTGFTTLDMPLNEVGIVPEQKKTSETRAETIRVAAAAAPRAPVPGAVETVVVTAQHKSENIQNVPIAVTALSQAQLTERQVAGGPDLVKEVPNLTFSKTNFSGYNLEIRGIGTQAISVTTDPAVAVAFNDIPFIRNHFFEQEFYDLQDAEVLRGPQGTLYGRNATAGVVNIKSALPDDQYEAMLSADLGNYSNRRLEGMLNIPIVGDTLDIRFAGEWTKRDGYTEDTTLNTPVDGRDLWSGRMTIGWKPASDVQIYLVWEHFSEDDDRLRSGKQLCKTAPGPTSINGVPVLPGTLQLYGGNDVFQLNDDYLSQGCEATSLYSPDAFEVPYGFSLPYAVALGVANGANPAIDPYAGTTQSTNLRDIQSTILPTYKAKNDTLEFNATYTINPALTFTSQTGYNQDFLWSTEDYNRFDTSPGIFTPGGGPRGHINANGVFCDPQLGCSNRIVGEDLSDEHAWQLSQEFRLTSNFSGPFNFSVGGNYLHYETEENYFVFVNALTVFAGGEAGYDNIQCALTGGNGYQPRNPILGGGEPEPGCYYTDPNPVTSLNNQGHNYFLSQNPYMLNSYAGFGEAYYDITNDLKLTGGLRWTDDQKHFIDIPSELLTYGVGYLATGTVDQSWGRFTGRAVLDWTPKLDFTDQTLLYASYAHGYKAGGANPPGAVLPVLGPGVGEPIHPLTFKPEYIEAFELGTKNTLLDSSLTLNGDIFYYNYTGYQISEIVDRTAINNNYNAHVEGAEVQANWEPLPGLKFNFAGGWEDTAAAGGDSGIDLMDRTAGMPGWMVVKPFPTAASNCILPDYVLQAVLEEYSGYGIQNNAASVFACSHAYIEHLDPATLYPYAPNPTGLSGVGYEGCGGDYPCVSFPIPSGYPGFNPNTPAYNNGEGFAKNLSGHALPNAPPFTVSLGGEYTMPVSDDWAATLRGDFYWQADSWARIFNDNPYDRIHGYDTLNLSLILTSANGWQVMGYVKNVFNVTAITGDFLNSDDSGLTTNVFLTDPRLIGVRVTKQLDEADGFWGSSYSGADFFTGLFSDTDGGRPPLWIELGGQFEHIGGQGASFTPAFLAANPASPVLQKTTPVQAQEPPLSFGEEAKVSYQPDGSDWVVSASIRISRSSNFKHVDHQTKGTFHSKYKSGVPTDGLGTIEDFANTQVHRSESHSVLDFVAGKDVGLGMFGLNGSSTLSGGVRIAQFTSKEMFDVRARPDLQFHDHVYAFPGYPHYTAHLPHWHTYYATGQSSRSFHGIGPSLSWKGAVPFAGDPQNGEMTVDWGANAAILFGRQKASVRHQESGHYVYHGIKYHHGTSPYQHSGGHAIDRRVTVPNLGGFAGISWRYQNAKVSFGYRIDEFFGAVDGGIDKPKSETLNMGGPFATISFGLGG